MNKSEAYIAAHRHRAAALVETAMYAIPARWGINLGSNARPRAPDSTITPPDVRKSPAQQEAIYGKPGSIAALQKDSRFEAPSSIWMLNLLKFEPGRGPELYAEYAIRARHKISELSGG